MDFKLHHRWKNQSCSMKIANESSDVTLCGLPLSDELIALASKVGYNITFTRVKTMTHMLLEDLRRNCVSTCQSTSLILVAKPVSRLKKFGDPKRLKICEKMY